MLACCAARNLQRCRFGRLAEVPGFFAHCKLQTVNCKLCIQSTDLFDKAIAICWNKLKVVILSLTPQAAAVFTFCQRACHKLRGGVPLSGSSGVDDGGSNLLLERRVGHAHAKLKHSRIDLLIHSLVHSVIHSFTRYLEHIVSFKSKTLFLVVVLPREARD